jgi:TfoX/Sxy family transcriptional regulator of competence genes
MATEAKFLDYVLEQAALGEQLTAKKMFGEYGLYLDGKVIGFLADNCLFLKTSAALDALLPHLPKAPAYPGSKPYTVGDELLDDSDLLRRVLRLVAENTPLAKPKAAKSASKSKRHSAQD